MHRETMTRRRHCASKIYLQCYTSRTNRTSVVVRYACAALTKDYSRKYASLYRQVFSPCLSFTSRLIDLDLLTGDYNTTYHSQVKQKNSAKPGVYMQRLYYDRRKLFLVRCDSTVKITQIKSTVCQCAL